MMGGTKEPGLELSETDVAMCAIDAIHYAVEKAGGNRQRFAYELSGEFTNALCERSSVQLDE